EALRSKQIAGAGLDVWDKEPPAADHPLLQFDNVIASPHTAGMTREARANMGRIAAEQLVMTLDGKRPPRIVNPQVWPAYAERFGQPLGFRPQGYPRTTSAGAAPSVPGAGSRRRAGRRSGGRRDGLRGARPDGQGARPASARPRSTATLRLR